VTGQVVDYTVYVGASETLFLTSGVPVTDMIDNVNVLDRTYRFNGEAGQRIRITLSSLNDAYAPGLDVTNSETQELLVNVYSGVDGTFNYETTLPTSGLYLLRVFNSYVDDTVAAEFSLLVEVLE